MKRENIFATFIGYARHHWRSVGIFALFSGIFALVFSLYKLPVEAIFYSVALCICLWLIFLLIDFSVYYKRHNLLAQLRGKIILGTEALPPPANLIEGDYRALIRAVYDEKIRIVSQGDNNVSDMIDYYTLWAHQIKTPISAMQLLLQDTDTAQNKALTAELFKIERYVDMVLSYLRLGSDSTDFVLCRLPLEPIVKQAVRKYAPLFISKKISIDLGPLDFHVLTDEKWLAFVIEQLLSNALKYTHSGTISIYMQAPKTLVIQDSGIGIAQEDLPRICEKSFTGYNGHRDKKASGLGLYLCKLVLTRLGHTITITSEIARGTCVYIGLDSIDTIID